MIDQPPDASLVFSNPPPLQSSSAWIVKVVRHQARNQLATPGGAKSFPRGAQIFWTMSSNFKLPTHFSRGGEKFSRGASPRLPAPHLVTVLSGTVTHILHRLTFAPVAIDQWSSNFPARWPPIKVYNFLSTPRPSPTVTNKYKESMCRNKFDYFFLEM